MRNRWLHAKYLGSAHRSTVLKYQHHSHRLIKSPWCCNCLRLKLRCVYLHHKCPNSPMTHSNMLPLSWHLKLESCHMLQQKQINCTILINNWKAVLRSWYKGVYLWMWTVYAEARHLLHMEYGDPFKVATAHIQKENNWPNLKADNSQGLRTLSHFLTKCTNAMQNITHMNVLNHPMNMQTIVLKLPLYLQNKWTMAKSGIKTTVNTISSCWKLWTFSWKGIYGCSTRHRQLICLTRQQLYWWYIEPHYMSYHWNQRFSTCFWCLQSNNMAGLQTTPGWALTIVMLHTRKWSKTFDIFMIKFSFSCLRNLWYVQ